MSPVGAQFGRSKHLSSANDVDQIRLKRQSIRSFQLSPLCRSVQSHTDLGLLLWRIPGTWPV